MERLIQGRIIQRGIIERGTNETGVKQKNITQGNGDNKGCEIRDYVGRNNRGGIKDGKIFRAGYDWNG